MSIRHTYTVLIPATTLTAGTRRNIAGVQRVYFDSRKELLAFCKRAASKGGKLQIAVQSYVSLAKGLAGCGRLLDFATYTEKSGLLLHGLTPARETILRRYIPQAA